MAKYTITATHPEQPAMFRRQFVQHPVEANTEFGRRTLPIDKTKRTVVTVTRSVPVGKQLVQVFQNLGMRVKVDKEDE